MNLSALFRQVVIPQGRQGGRLRRDGDHHRGPHRAGLRHRVGDHLPQGCPPRRTEILVQVRARP